MKDNIVSILDNVVFLDLETSGLNPVNSEILEIGAVKFVDKKAYEFSSLVRNKFKVTPEIFSLCKGLKQSDLDKALYLEQIKDDFLEFIEDKTIICHNKSFEMSFLNHHIGYIENKFLDSMELAVILEPYHREFNLDYLKKSLTTNKEDEIHRALSDAIDTVDVVNSLLIRFKQNVEEGSSFTLYPSFEIDSYLNSHQLGNWEWSDYINDADFSIAEHTKTVYKEKNLKVKSSDELNPKEIEIEEKLKKNNFRYEKLLADENIWAAKKGFMYEFRKGQYDLTESIRMTFDKTQSNILCMEAPTGIGKSVGYLLPAVLEAKHRKKRIIISTATKDLQVQLIQKDLPNVINSLGLSNKVSYGYIKGKNNYICRKKFEEYKKSYQTDEPTYDDILSIIIIENLIKDGEYADVEEINFWALNHFKNLGKHLIKVICDVDLCKPKKCTELCHYKTRVEELQTEDITVINHSLLARWPYIEEKPLENIIVDEAHNLVEKGYDFFTSEIEYYSLKYLMSELYPYEFMADCRFFPRDKNLRKIKMMDKFYKEINLDKEQKSKIGRYINFILENMTEILQFAVENEYDSMVNYGLHWEINLQKDDLIGKKIEENGDYTEITYNPYSQIIKENVDSIMSEIKRVAILIDRAMDDDNLDKESELYKYGKSKIKNLEDIYLTLERFLEDDKDDLIARIVEINKDFNNFSIKVVPLNLDELFRENILSILENGVFVSATLTVDSKMDYFVNTLGINKVNHNKKIIEPIYDYKNKIDVIRTVDTGGYRSEDFIQNIALNIERLQEATSANVLSLFNSKKRQDDTYLILEEELHKKDISIYQNKKGIKFLKNAENKSVVLGSKGCFEGVDVPGDALVCVTIDKVPNLNPRDPLYYSIIKKLNRSYHDVNYPQMIIKVKQALGRLLRSKYDYGVFVLFDVGKEKVVSDLQKNLHGCKIVDVRGQDLKAYTYPRIRNKRKQLLFKLIKEIVSIYKFEGSQEDLVEYIQREARNRSIKLNLSKENEKNNIFLEYYDIKYIVDINKI